MFLALYANMYLSLDYAVSLVLLNAGMDNKLHLQSILSTEDVPFCFQQNQNIKILVKLMKISQFIFSLCVSFLIIIELHPLSGVYGSSPALEFQLESYLTENVVRKIVGIFCYSKALCPFVYCTKL